MKVHRLRNDKLKQTNENMIEPEKLNRLLDYTEKQTQVPWLPIGWLDEPIRNSGQTYDSVH